MSTPRQAHQEAHETLENSLRDFERLPDNTLRSTYGRRSFDAIVDALSKFNSRADTFVGTLVDHGRQTTAEEIAEIVGIARQAIETYVNYRLILATKAAKYNYDLPVPSVAGLKNCQRHLVGFDTEVASRLWRLLVDAKLPAAGFEELRGTPGLLEPTASPDTRPSVEPEAHKKPVEASPTPPGPPVEDKPKKDFSPGPEPADQTKLTPSPAPQPSGSSGKTTVALIPIAIVAVIVVVAWRLSIPEPIKCEPGRQPFEGRCVSNQIIDFVECLKGSKITKALEATERAVKGATSDGGVNFDMLLKNSIEREFATLPKEDLELVLRFCAAAAKPADIKISVVQPPDCPPGMVQIRDEFCINEAEITVDEFIKCESASAVDGCKPMEKLTLLPDCNRLHPDRYSHPMNCVNQNDAMAYCNWKYGDRQGSLPTESHWMTAVNGDSPKGGEFFTPKKDDVCWGKKSTCPVKAYPGGKTKTGLYDAVGNVSEWIIDTYEKNGTTYARNCGRSWAEDVSYELVGKCTGAYAAVARVPKIGFRCVAGVSRTPSSH